MRPHLRSRMPGITACVHRNTDFRLTAMVRSKSASVSVSTVRTRPMPALFTSTSTGPSACSVSAIIRATSTAWDTSARTAMALPPLSRISFTTLSAAAVCSR